MLLHFHDRRLRGKWYLEWKEKPNRKKGKTFLELSLVCFVFYGVINGIEGGEDEGHRNVCLGNLMCTGAAGFSFQRPGPFATED